MGHVTASRLEDFRRTAARLLPEVLGVHRGGGPRPPPSSDVDVFQHDASEEQLGPEMEQ